ncbi:MULTISPECIES: hypothetical protein [unclassified Lactobacillus]|uniref:hypothetical protein n=1 Tax=unclassified Lactobacillus TaxID=2620435 RepID=UPI001CE63B15|nr:MULTISPECIES: hypothetical protein [unclassified Lactobacillus]QYN56827.1 hypothetical protein GYM69_06690 [Lactobacillus panisapium]
MITISLFISVVSLLGDWLLFSFPLYQGLMELYDYQRFLKDFDNSSKALAKISPWYWFLPNLKIHYEKSRAVKILKTIIKSDTDFRSAMSFIDKATAWYFVAMGGWFKMIQSMYDFLDEIGVHHDAWWLVIGVVLSTFTGLFSAYYRVSPHRQKAMLNKFNKVE